MSEITCPISDDRVDENTTRVVAAIVITIGVFTLYTGYSLPIFLLAADFAVRGFTNKPYSVLRLAARNISAVLNLPVKPVNAAPKKFAAGVGFAFCMAIGLALLLGFYKTAYGVGAVLLVCAVLEFAFAYCVGCVVYTFMVLPLIKKH